MPREILLKIFLRGIDESVKLQGIVINKYLYVCCMLDSIFFKNITGIETYLKEILTETQLYYIWIKLIKSWDIR